MPKEWDPHKAEIERLYMVEGLPLKDVRNIMRTRFTFDASIRAYRMKLDEWQFWKNNSKNDRRATKTRSRLHHLQPAIEMFDSEDPVPSSAVRASQPPPLVNLPTAPSYLGHFNEHQTSNTASKISETLLLISSLYFTPGRGLEQMLRNWVSDGSYLEAALTYLDDNRSRFRIDYRTPQKTGIFDSITVHVAAHETFPLAKKCLEIDFEQAQTPNIRNKEWDVHPDWMNIWRAACALRDWQEVLKCAHLIDLEPEGPGILFTSTALPFLAEKILKRNLEQLERWNQGGHQFDACIEESMLILSSIKTDMFDVEKTWYKRFLQINQTHFAQKGNPDQSSQLEEYRRKFLQLQMLHESIDQSDYSVQNLLNAENVLKESKVILDAAADGDVSPAKNGIPARPTTPVVIQPESSRLYKAGCAVQILIEKMYKRWSWGNEIRDDIDSILKHLSATGLSDPLCAEKNPFILISQTIAPRDQVRFTAAILAEVHKEYWIFNLQGKNMTWTAWLCVHQISTLRQLLMIADLPDALEFYLDDRIGPDAVKLALDASTMFAGGLALSDLKHTILQHTSSSSVDYVKPRFDYMTILNLLQARKLQVDQKWTRFLGRMLVWELTDVANIGTLFESSEEENDGSANDSTFSDIDESENEQVSEVVS